VDKKDLAKRLLATEDLLNKIEIKGPDLGSLLSKFNENIYNNKNKRLLTLPFIRLILTALLKGVFLTQPKARQIKSEVLLSKLADRAHCNALINPIKEYFQSNAVLYTPGFFNELGSYNFPRKLKLSSFSILLKKWTEIRGVYQSKGLKVDGLNLFHALLTQLSAFKNWSDFFSQFKPKIVLVDFDRDNRNSAMVLAAKINRIPTATLVHGVLNPPYGYWPIIADEIWCWGNFQRNQLIAHGVDKNKIRIVGSPIAIRNNESYIGRGNRPINNIGIGLNPVKEDDNKLMLKKLLLNPISLQVKWTIKLHPSMLKKEWMLEFENENVTIFTHNEYSLVNFFKSIDLLIVGNSGIGFEAITNDIPIWVYRADQNTSGHDEVMINQANCPDITLTNNLSSHLQSLIDFDDYLHSLLRVEQQFVLNDFYFATGPQAIKNVIDAIEIKLLKCE